MILVYLVAIPLICGLLSWVAGSRSHAAARVIALTGNAAVLVLSGIIWLTSNSTAGLAEPGQWLRTFSTDWIPQAGIAFTLGLDGLSLLMILMTAVLGLVSVVISWTEVNERVGFFHFNLMWTLAGIIGVFMALDLFLFYFFWEMMLIPMYFLIGIWGHERRRYASIKFFLFTQLSGLFMLAAIVALALINQAQTGLVSFNYFDLLQTETGIVAGRWLMLGFLVAFAVKIPMVPLHTWLADAHTEAPTAGSIILAGLLLKTGAYGLIRFVIPFFPEAADYFAVPLMILGVAGIIYGAILAFAQNDLKRLVAYTSVSHLGFVVLGVFSFDYLALQGSVMQMICHGFSTGGLFVLVGMLQEKTGTRDINRLGGLWKSLPRAGGAAMFLAMASLGLPGMGNFVAEFLVLAGSYRSHQVVAIIAAVGLIPAAVYSLHLIQKTFHGKPREKWEISDAGPRHVVVLAAMIAVLIWLGLYPQSIIDTAEPALRTTEVTTAVPARSHPTGWSLGYHEHVDMTAIEIPAETEEPLNDLR